MSDKTTEMIAALMETINESLKLADCDSLRFTLVVWCDCDDLPLYFGSNEMDTLRLLKMLKGAADGVLDTHEVTEGHA